MDRKRLLVVSEVASMLRVPPARVYKLGRNGDLPVVRIGRQVRVDPTVLGDWIREGGAGLGEGKLPDGPRPGSPSGTTE